ncbi:hypothetical protein KCU65_g9080, partial [Aureobasidium melanogenum]
MPKRSESKNKPSTLAKADRSQDHTIMHKNHSSAENHTTNETNTNFLSNQPHKQAEKQTNKETPDYSTIKTHTSDSKSTVDKKHAVESAEDLKRRLAESRRFADEMEEKLRRLIERNRKVVGLGQ